MALLCRSNMPMLNLRVEGAFDRIWWGPSETALTRLDSLGLPAIVQSIRYDEGRRGFVVVYHAAFDLALDFVPLELLERYRPFSVLSATDAEKDDIWTTVEQLALAVVMVKLRDSSNKVMKILDRASAP